MTLTSLIGFGLAAYAVIAYDVIQTPGTFLTSNAKKTLDCITYLCLDYSDSKISYWLVIE
jgi:hypothetical protein